MKTQNLGLWIVVYTLLILDIGLNTVRAQNTAPKQVNASEMQIVDSSGNERVDLFAGKDGNPVISMKDDKGNIRLGLIVQADGAHLVTFGADGKSTLLVNGGDAPSVILLKSGNPSALISLKNGTDPSLELQDAAGTDRLLASYRPGADSSFVSINDKNGKQSAELADAPTYSIVDVSDSTNTRRVALRCTSAGVAGAFVADKTGKPVWSKTDSGGQ